MLNGQLSYDLSLPIDRNLDSYFSQQIQNLLQTCCCDIIKGKDYELEAAANAVNALIDEHETADVYLYAAIERKDWQEVNRLYQSIFRPYLLETATQAIQKKLSKRTVA